MTDTKTKRGPFKSVSEIEAANRAMGDHWFSPSTLQFFASRMEPEVYGGYFFVTSEKACFTDYTRVWHVRRADVYGNITSGRDGRVDYQTKELAVAAARAAVER